MKAKRSLGQNFFVNSNLADLIVSKLPKCSTVVEIGPGQGYFTQRLINRFNKVIVIEKDNVLAQNLKDTYPNITVYNEDFLDFDLSKIQEKDISFYGSLPYNVSKPIIRKIIQSDLFTNPSYFIVQKEVAEKYIYQKPYNILSLTTHIYADTKRVLDISPDSFRPRPKVNSSVIEIKPNRLEITDTKTLEDLIVKSFKQPRKNLKNNLRNTKYTEKISNYEEKRASELSLDEYINILNN